MVLLVGLTLGFVGCAEKEQAAPEPEAEPEVEMQAEAPEPAEAPEVEEAVAEEAAADETVVDEAVADGTVAVIEEWRDEELLDHMHVHAEQLDEINYALDDGDLESAKTPASWLARHKMVDGIPDELQPYVDGMRAAAADVESAEDVETAKAAAERIAEQCQGCHVETGADIP